MEFRGYDEVLAYAKQTRLWADGTPRTRHVLTNLHIEIDGNRGDRSQHVEWQNEMPAPK